MEASIHRTYYAIFGKGDPDKERKEVQEARGKALEKLYAKKPSTRQQLKEAKGYAVFSSLGMNLFLISIERGDGVLRVNSSGKDIYMKMFSGGGYHYLSINRRGYCFAGNSAGNQVLVRRKAELGEPGASACCRSIDILEFRPSLSPTIPNGPDVGKENIFAFLRVGKEIVDAGHSVLHGLTEY